MSSPGCKKCEFFILTEFNNRFYSGCTNKVIVRQYSNPLSNMDSNKAVYTNSATMLHKIQNCYNYEDSIEYKLHKLRLME